MNVSLSAELASWVSQLSFDCLPADVVEATKLRVFDVIGLALAGAETAFGKSIRDALVALSSGGPCRVLGTGDKLALTGAAFINGALSQALEFDDTHNESIVHMSSPAVAAALAISETRLTSGRDLITAIALGNEISCRVGSAASGQFHKRGFHPTGLFAPFGSTYLASKLLALEVEHMVHAAGICGSFSSGLLQCWVDGTQTKFLHPGWAAQSGITAAFLAQAGTTGPAEVLEGRFGLFASHLQDPAQPCEFGRLVNDLGSHWESRNSSFKPFPAAHVLHPYISAALRLRSRHAIRADDIERIDCPVADFIKGIVCEPAGEKCAPASDSHGRVSLQYSLAEALTLGSLGKSAYDEQSRLNPDILRLARRVHYSVDPGYPGPGRFKGEVRITLKDGSTFHELEEYNHGSAENPMSYAEIRAKFDDNASGFLSPSGKDRLADHIERLENLDDASLLVTLACPSGGR